MASNASWQAWLYRQNQQLYANLIDHLRTQRGCNGNRDKMTEIFKALTATAASETALADFLKREFPHLILPDAAPKHQQPLRTAAAAVAVPGIVFSHYSPGLLTYPRKHVIAAPRAQLERLVRQFLSGKGHYDYVIVGDAAFIEYLPLEENRMYESIPVKNWETTAWKTKYQSQ